jgi:DNA-binding transcriptional LysR family regulator
MRQYAVSVARPLEHYDVDVHAGALEEPRSVLPPRPTTAPRGIQLLRRHLASGALVRVLEDWCPPFPGFFLYYPSRKQQPAALAAVIEAFRL